MAFCRGQFWLMLLTSVLVGSVVSKQLVIWMHQRDKYQRTEVTLHWNPDTCRIWEAYRGPLEIRPTVLLFLSCSAENR